MRLISCLIHQRSREPGESFRGATVTTKDNLAKTKRDKFKAKLRGKKHRLPPDVIGRAFADEENLTGAELSRRLRLDCKAFTKAT